MLAAAAFTVLASVPLCTGAAKPHDPLLALAGQNAALAAQVAAVPAAIGRAQEELAALRKSKDELETDVRRAEASVKLHAPGGELAQTISELLRELPKPGQFRAAHTARQGLLLATSDADLRDRRRLNALGDMDGAVAAQLAAAAPPVPEADRPRVEAATRELLAAQRDLLGRAIEARHTLMLALREADAAAHALEEQSRAARVNLTRLVFWMPSPPGARTFTELYDAIAWTFAPSNWRAAATVLRNEVARSPFWPVAALLVVIGLLAARGRLQRRLVALTPAAVTTERYGIGHTLAAMAVSLAIVLPAAIALWTVGMLLEAAPDTQRFAQALGDTLPRLALLWVALYGVAWLVDRRGLGAGHFGWDEPSLAFTARVLRRFAAVFIPVIFVTVLNLDVNAPYGNRESLGRVGTVIAMAVVAWLIVCLFRRRSPLVQGLAARAPRGWGLRLHPVWFAALLAVPLGVAVLAAIGYFMAAALFFGRVIHSVYLVFAALTLYGLVALWVQLRGASAARETAAAPRQGVTRVEIAAIGEQTRALLDLLITLLLVAGMWLVWREAMPLVSSIADYALWTRTETVNGKTVTHALTVANLLLAIVIGVVTAVAVRNAGALLDLVLLQRITIQADATYAIKVMTRYTLTAVGVLLACGVLGIGWNDAQWLVAALSVGLGFGLQEIFANFVSGIIILAERPIRIGDVVTVGDISGTVTRIRARSTTVTDFDNKEVLIPNKSFITDRVINWTLSSQTTRLVLKMGVAAGADVALAQRVMLDTVQRNPGVLREPAPSAFIAGFGDGSVDFEIRVFVDSFDRRLSVQHELHVALAGALRANGIEIAVGSAQ